MRLLGKHRVYLHISRKILYQSFALKVGVGLTHEVRLTQVLRGSVLDGLCKHIHRRVHLRDTR